MRFISSVVLAALLAGCASVPPAMRVEGIDPATVKQVQEHPEDHIGHKIRWGGVIVSLTNTAAGSEMVVITRPLDSISRPLPGESSSGRFILHSNEFIDPAVYTEHREITVVGVLQKVDTRKIGDFPYLYPVVESSAVHLWPVRLPPPEDYWNDPFYPYYYYPPWWYYGHSHRHR